MNSVWAQGFDPRFDNEPNCGPGTKPCGKICIQQDKDCRLSKAAIGSGLLAGAALGVLAGGYALKRRSNKQWNAANDFRRAGSALYGSRTPEQIKVNTGRAFEMANKARKNERRGKLLRELGASGAILGTAGLVRNAVQQRKATELNRERREREENKG